MPGPKREPFDPWLIPPDHPPPPRLAEPAIQGPQTVSQITALIKQAISRSLPATVHVVGQISNLKRQTSGHLYFTLKDAHCELPCVMWRAEATRLKFKPDNGLEVVASGTIEVFDRAGRYQLYVRRLEPRGVGSLELAFRQLCERLTKEGLFDEHRKKKIPRLPRRIAIVTSPTGAAIADMLRTMGRRFPCVQVLLYPVRVQGDEAAGEIAAAIRMLNVHATRFGGIDVLIIARGGGSLEDLWAFNEEVVARAIFASTIPVISGVGHEVDTTIADLVADVRAATPTAAAQIAVPMLDDLLSMLSGIRDRMRRAMLARQEAAGQMLRSLSRRSPFQDPFAAIRSRVQFLDLMVHKVHRSQGSRIGTIRPRLDRMERLLQRIAPRAILGAYANRLARLDRGLREYLGKRLSARVRSAEATAIKLQRNSPTRSLEISRHRLGNERGNLKAAENRLMFTLAGRLNVAEATLQAVSHQSVLARGYSLTRLKNAGRILRSVAEVHPGDVIETQLLDGQLDSTVNS